MTEKQIAANHNASSRAQAARVPWVDLIKGICIVSVVAMWVDRHLGLQSGWLHAYAIFARPFRMPDFFLISGLFLDKVIDRPWKIYLDRKVLHYIYFVLLWALLTLIIGEWILNRPPSLSVAAEDYILYIAQPTGSLWFITMLPIYFVVTKFIRNIHSSAVILCAAYLYFFPINTGIHLVDWFGEYYFYFYTGYAGSRYIFKMADWANERNILGAAYISGWAAANAVITTRYSSSWTEHLFLFMVMGYSGILALIFLSRLAASFLAFRWLAYLGENSIAVYLGFYIPLLFAGFAARRVGIDLRIGVFPTFVCLFCVVMPILLHFVIARTPLNFVFSRPKSLSITKQRS